MTRRHFLAAYHLKTTGPAVTPEDLMDAIEAFATTEKKLLDMEDAQRVLKIERFQRSGSRATAVLKTGGYGIRCQMVDRTDGKETHKRTEDDADLIPLHVSLDASVVAPGPLAVFHKLGRQGARTSFEVQLNRYLRSNAHGFQTQFVRVAPAVVVTDWAKRGHVARITFHKRETGKDAVGDLELIQARMADNPSKKRQRKPPPMAVDRSLTIEVRWGHFKQTKIMAWLRGTEPAASDLAELLDVKGFGPDTVDITVDTEGRRTKTFRIGSEFKVDEDISETVPHSHNEEQVRSAVFKAAREYIQKLAG